MPSPQYASPGAGGYGYYVMHPSMMGVPAGHVMPPPQGHSYPATSPVASGQAPWVALTLFEMYRMYHDNPATYHHTA